MCIYLNLQPLSQYFTLPIFFSLSYLPNKDNAYNIVSSKNTSLKQDCSKIHFKLITSIFWWFKIMATFFLDSTYK